MHTICIDLVFKSDRFWKPGGYLAGST